MRFEEIIDIIIKKINELPNKEPILVAIDGDCASGKTTLSRKIKEIVECNIIHMDDFFLRPEQRTPMRYNEPGGNVDYERFWTEVMEPLLKNEIFRYRPFDCSKGALGEEILVYNKAINIIEGSYSCHPSLCEYYDLKIFLSIDEDVQQQRILSRNGKEALKIFNDKWIPLEKKYFKECKTKDKCHITFHIN